MLCCSFSLRGFPRCVGVVAGWRFQGRDRFEVLRLEIGIPMAPVGTVKGEASGRGSYPAEALLLQWVSDFKPAEPGRTSGIAAVFRQGHS